MAACPTEQAEICPQLFYQHVNLERAQEGPASTLTPTVQCLGSSDSRMVTLSRALSSPVILALAIGRGSEASI